MGATTPDNIAFPDASYPGGFEAAMALMASTVQAALDNRAIRSFSWTSQIAQNAEADMRPGDEGYRSDIDAAYIYTGAGVWRRQYPAGLVPIKPTAVVASAGTVSFVGNRVVVSQVPGTLRLDGIFTSDFTNYKILVDMESISATAESCVL